MGGGPDVSACRSCGAEILWAHTRDGKRIPLDAVPSPAGNVYLNESATFARASVLSGALLEAARSAGEKLRTSHFATCPQAGEWRRKRG